MPMRLQCMVHIPHIPFYMYFPLWSPNRVVGRYLRMGKSTIVVGSWHHTMCHIWFDAPSSFALSKRLFFLHKMDTDSHGKI